MRNPVVQAIRAIKSECSEGAGVRYDPRSRVLVIEPKGEDEYQEDLVYEGATLMGMPVRVVRPTRTAPALPSAP